MAIDLARGLTHSPVLAYSIVFASEGALFLVAAWLAARVDAARREEGETPPVAGGAAAPAFALETRGA